MENTIHPKVQQLANATKTYYGAGGHSKAIRNEDAAERIKSELIADGIEIPDINTLLEIGKFNGEGSV